MQYLYTDPTPRPVIPASVELMGAVPVFNQSGADGYFVLPEGVKVGDYFVLATSTGLVPARQPSCATTTVRSTGRTFLRTSLSTHGPMASASSTDVPRTL